MGYDKSVYDEVNAKITDMEYCYGPSSILYPADCDGSRLYMGIQNQKQYVTLNNPDIARVQTGHERSFGKYSHAYKDLEGRWKVVKKITKFGNDNIYTLVLYNEDTDTYDMLEKIPARYIAENFGFAYNTAVMDSLEVGDVVDNPTLYKSTSYDKNMNYRLGRNALVMYSSDTSTYEDGIKIRRGFLKELAYNEVGQISVPINDNDILLFMHGDKSFPEVGELITDNEVLCATRRYNSMYATYDFQEKNVHTVCATDNRYYIKLNSIVYDIDVYYNGDGPMPDTIYNKQLRQYYDYCCAYADELYETATELKKSGSNYTDNIAIFRKKYKDYSNPEVKWKFKDRVFSNVVIIFKTRSICYPKEGCKLVGRYGDKGVISKICDGMQQTKYEYDREEFDAFTQILADNLGVDLTDISHKDINIVDDESMYYMEDGTPVDIMLNGTGAFRRLNTGQLYEVDLNFIAEQHRRWITTLENDDIKLKEIFDFIKMVNKNELSIFLNAFKVHADADELSAITDPEIKRAIVSSVERDGYYFFKPTSANLRYDAFAEIYDKYDSIIEPYQLYVNIFGMKKPVIKKAVIGYKYMFLLKQTSNKNFSARSTGTTTKAGLPSKSADKKEGRIVNSNTPICISEISDLQTQLPLVVLAEHNIWTRTSVIGRKALGKIISATGDPMNVGSFKVKSEHVNDNVLALKARMKVMGIGYDFVTNKSLREKEIGNIRQFLNVYKYTFFDAPVNRKYYVYLIDRYNREIVDGMTPGDPEIWRKIITSKDIEFLEIPSYVFKLVHDVLYPERDEDTFVLEKEEEAS